MALRGADYSFDELVAGREVVVQWWAQRDEAGRWTLAIQPDGGPKVQVLTPPGMTWDGLCDLLVTSLRAERLG